MLDLLVAGVQSTKTPQVPGSDMALLDARCRGRRPCSWWSIWMAAAAIVLMPISGVRSPAEDVLNKAAKASEPPTNRFFIPLFRGRHRTRFGRGYANSWEFSRFRSTTILSRENAPELPKIVWGHKFWTKILSQKLSHSRHSLTHSLTYSLTHSKHSPIIPSVPTVCNSDPRGEIYCVRFISHHVTAYVLR